MSKRGLVILGIVVLAGTWLFVVGYEFMEKENALFQKRVKAAKEDQQRCTARYAKYRNFDQFRTSVRVPYASDLPVERWMQQFNTLHAGMNESEVGIIMGAPDFARCNVNKDGDKFVGSMWQYEVTVPQDLANDGQNSAIQLTFGPDGKLLDKNAMNMQPNPTPTPVPVITPLPSPAASPGSNAPSAASTPDAIAAPSATPLPQATPAVTASPTPQ